PPPMSRLTSRLADLIATDNAILFVGNALRASHNPPAIEQIAEALAARIEYVRPDRSLSAVARDYEVLKGRNALITALREELRKLQAGPDPLHQLIADAVLPHTKVLTTRFDQILERALDQFQKPYVLIVRDADVPFFDEAKITLIKMQGDIDQPDSLIITEDDLDDFIRRLPTISDVVRAFFATKTLIFLGYDLNSPLFKRFYNQVTRNLSAFRRQAYAVVPEPLDPVEDKYWAAQNVETLEENPLQFLEDLAAAVKAEIQTPRDPEPTDRLLELQKGSLPDRPYKALDSFTTADAAIFSGRTEESQRLANRILAHRLTLLYGESGSGKSSLMNAGVTPRLLQQRSLVATCTPSPDQPLTEIMRRALLETGQRAGLTPPSESFLVTVREWQRALSGPIVLVLDQFEQFFLVYNSFERTTAARLFHELHEDRSLNLRLVFILREDFLGRLQTLEDLVPGLMDVRFRLEKLGRENARAALEDPARLFNGTWESFLLNRLLDELTTPDGDISPPQLQLVADQLWQDAVKRNSGPSPESHPTPKPDRAVSLTLKRFTELGGVQAILGDYLDQTVAAFPTDDQPLVRLLLGALVSSGGVKQRLPLEDIARTADLPPEKAAEILDHLTRQRLLQRYETPIHNQQSTINNSPAPFDYAKPPSFESRTSLRVLPTNQPTDQPTNQQTSYELTHDYLVPRITRWLGQEFWDAQRAREIIRQDYPAWTARQRLLALDDLKIINAQRGRVRLTPQETEMVLATAAAFEDDISFWQTLLPVTDCQRVLLNLLTHLEDAPRARAAFHLGAYPDPAVSAALVKCALKDTSSTVRESAAAAISRLVNDAPKPVSQVAIDGLVAAQADPLALAALIAIRDARPSVDALLPASVRGQITRKVWALRLNRHRGEIVEMILNGLQGGFLALGFGMGIFFGLGSAQDLSILPFLRILGLIYFGIAMAGVLGATVGASTATNQAVFRYILDEERPFARWLSGTTVSAVVMALSFLFLSGIFAGEPRVGLALAAGALIGAGLTAPAIAPLRVGRGIRLGLSALSGVIVFLIANQLLFNQAIIWGALMGLAGGIGFFLAFNWKKSDPLSTPNSLR
ncbi:MAG: SIR2 family protein, partial [Anaerolineales bacterium]|nr:SIR2 family protein [Anaerolineales bacterium]